MRKGGRKGGREGGREGEERREGGGERGCYTQVVAMYAKIELNCQIFKTTFSSQDSIC